MFAFVSGRTHTDEIYIMDVGHSIIHRHNPINTLGQLPSWSPDGLLAFDNDDQLRIDDGHDTTIVETPPRLLHPQWSSDGTHIAFLAIDDEGIQNIYVWNRYNGEIDQLTDQSDSVSIFEWSPDSTRIAFRHDPSRDSDIYILDIEIGDIYAIDIIRQRAGSSFTWSPDGTRLAFSVSDDAGTNIMIWNSLDNSVQPLVENAAYPAWSPDGEWLAYTVWLGDGSDVFIFHIASGETHNLTNNPKNLFLPNWSPDGTYLTFMVNQFGGAFDLYLVEIATGDVRNLTNNGGRWIDYQLAWRP